MPLFWFTLGIAAGWFIAAIGLIVLFAVTENLPGLTRDQGQDHHKEDV